MKDKEKRKDGKEVGLRSVFLSHSALKWNNRGWAFFSDKERSTRRYVVGSCLTGLRGDRVIILYWRWRLGEQERGLRRKDILQAVPLVCVMVPKGCVLALLTVMIVGVELNSPCQKYWSYQKDTPQTTPIIQRYHNTSTNQYFVLLMGHSAWGKFSNDDTWYNNGLCRA